MNGMAQADWLGSQQHERYQGRPTMSREVRRVPVDWKHPVEHNPYWLEQSLTPFGRSRPLSWLHAQSDRFIGLMDDYPGRRAEWERELREAKAREGHRWTFGLEYHLTGYQGHDDAEPVIHPLYGWSDDGETETSVKCRDADHFYEHLVAEIEREEPSPEDYMPVFDEPEEELGWVLYETVSEGTPVSPVFKTPEELIEHLTIIGQDWDQEPMRPAAAEALVRGGSSAGSFMVIGNTLYDGSKDLDLIEQLPKVAP